MKKVNLIILLCVLSTISTFFLASDFTLGYLAFSWKNLLQGRFWTPFTALFVHANLVHLLGNVVFLYVFGSTLEGEVGSAKTLAAFFAGGVIAFLLSVPFYGPEAPMLGSSAAIFALTAVVMLLKPLRFSLLFMMPLGLVAILYFLYNLLAIRYGFQGNVGYVSHAIGFAAGLPFGAAWGGRWKVNLLITLGLLALYFAIQLLLIPEILARVGLS